MQTKKEKVPTSKGIIEYSISGKGEPNIILMNGGSGPIEGWMKIIKEISKMSAVFAYNRLGVGDSEKPKENQDGITIIETLREALAVLNIKPPYLLVGHSLGGLYANLYARLYPDEVYGVVFLEASHPNDMLLDEHYGKIVKSVNKMLSRFDTLSAHKKFDEIHFVKKTIQQINEHPSFPEIPLYVITGGKANRLIPKEALKRRQENQLELLTLAKTSKQIIAKNSGHFPQLTDHKIVITTILEAVQNYKDKLE
ncbi:MULTISPECIES: alpha/beta hydrolase [Bacillaceae]|uniref:alpha/beta fold hydrolase n=1 Tax=Bacillaceae TaxID=186817 RepID=UPI001E3B48B2|nr:MULTISPECIES: alpha/beta hydrolase [Bacillaceae]MCE4049109.1 alpha/beta hydrolase [Bacillus sp. Au-Bac7]UPO90456.1 alpha/beta hydrolase [Niallia sp. Man26]